MLKKTIFLLFAIFIASVSYGQRSVQFLNNNLQSAITMAQSRNKLIFVDTYAPWCIPCKKMEVVFRDPELASYFNKTFVNLRVDMEGASGKEIHKRYNVIFLPTLMILDSKGNVKYQVDELMSADALLAIAKKIAEPELYAYQPQEPVAVFNPPQNNNGTQKKVETKPTPVPIQKTEEVLSPTSVEAPVTTEIATEQIITPSTSSEPIIEGTIGEEKILYVLNESDDVPPEILFQESYFRLQLMDGSHKATASQYIQSQEDWSSLRNMKFIYDFLYTTESEEFQYFIQNKEKFEKAFGKESVKQSIEILVSRRLTTGFPRPTLEEAKKLFSYLDSTNSEKMAFEYHLNNLYLSKKYPEYTSVANSYMEDYHFENHNVYYRLASIITESQNAELLGDGIDYIDKAIELNNANYLYYDTKAYLHFMNDEKKKALSSAKKAKKLANKIGASTEKIDVLLEMIGELE